MKGNQNMEFVIVEGFLGCCSIYRNNKYTGYTFSSEAKAQEWVDEVRQRLERPSTFDFMPLDCSEYYAQGISGVTYYGD